MKKRMILAAIMSFSLSVSAMASVIPQDFSTNNGGMVQWETDLFFFREKYPETMQLLQTNLEAYKAKAAEAQTKLAQLDDVVRLAAVNNIDSLQSEKDVTEQELDASRRAIVLYQAEIEKLDLDKVILEERRSTEFLPPFTFDAGEYQEQAQSLMQEEYIIPAVGRQTSPFGWRIHPVTGGRKLHEGLDLANDEGTPIHAAKSGIVTYAGFKKISGNNIVIRHFDGQETAYFHMSKLKVKEGDFVSQADVIGKMGTTGRSTGSHLHFIIMINGVKVDPAPYIFKGTIWERR